jgi:hypothetical protein
MVEITPIEVVEMEQCPTSMGSKLRDLIPQIERVLRDKDGKHPIAIYDIDVIKNAIGSSAVSQGGFVACINRLLDEQFADRTNIQAHSQGKGRISFDFEEQGK